MSGKISDPLVRNVQRFSTSLAVFCYIFLLAPIVIVVPIAFGTAGEMNFPPREWSLDLFRIFFSRSDWTAPFFQSFKIAIITTVIVLVLGCPASYALTRFQLRGKSIVAGLFLGSLVVPTVVTGLALYLYFSYLRLNGTLAALIFGHIVCTLPYVIVVIAAGVQKLDANLEFGAQLMGAGKTTMFVTVVLPQLVPSLIAASLFAFLISFDEVVISWFLAGSSTMTLPVKMYSSIRWEISPLIAAVSTVLTLISLIVCVITAFFNKADVKGER